MAICSCDYSLQNTGLPSCNYVIKYAVAAILTPMRDSTGVANKIASGTTVNDAHILTRLNDSDPTQRFYYLKNLKNTQMGTPAEPVYQTFDDTSKIKISNGITTASFIFAATSPTFLGKMQSFECEQMGIYFIDKEGYIIGIASGSDLIPIEIAANSLNSQPTYGTPTTTYQITTTFDWDLSVEHAEIATWSNTVNWNSTTIASLLDVTYSGVSGVTTTAFAMALVYEYGSLNTKLPVKGLVAGDFTLYNVTDSASVTILTCTETPDGTYTFTFAAQTSADVLRLSGTKNGFDFEQIEAAAIVIP